MAATWIRLLIRSAPISVAADVPRKRLRDIIMVSPRLKMSGDAGFETS
jgi:hypothetical protein